MSANKVPKLLIHAPNVHTGGGLRLLSGLFKVAPSPFAWLQLDKRIQNKISLPEHSYFVKKTLFSRLYAEWRLKKRCKKEDIVLCFHGLPPLFPLKGQAIVFLQNCLLFDKVNTARFPSLQKLRLFIESWWLIFFQKNANRYLVQSNTMLQLVRKHLHPDTPISLFPFACQNQKEPVEQEPVASDFVYIASGDPHKNHDNLLEAWVILANQNSKPKLLLTVDPKTYPKLCQKIQLYSASFGLDITNLGNVSQEEVHSVYQNSKALIYPSFAESFGLPLIEASAYALPILAAEKDYVREVVHPIETFDPHSPISIARAVKRFLKIDTPELNVQTAEALLAELLS